MQCGTLDLTRFSVSFSFEANVLVWLGLKVKRLARTAQPRVEASILTLAKTEAKTLRPRTFCETEVEADILATAEDKMSKTRTISRDQG